MKNINDITLVITSIAGPDSQVLMTYAKECGEREIPFIVIGDAKSPDNFQLEGCDFWSLDRQKTMEFTLAPVLPIRHYARKNLGYLTAIKNGAQTIVETDDDNYPFPDFWSVLERPRKVKAYDINDQGWVNVYRYFSDEMIWPRGFPLEKIQEKAKDLSHFVSKEVICPIQQGLADQNPDVDAVYRLTYPLPVQFNKGFQLALGQNAWCPFNSQNTFWFREAMPLMYLPSYCSFRMTDIWRSFIAQRIAWENEWSVLYHESTVWQERNAHNLLKDLEDEIPGYLNNQKITDVLMGLELVSGENAVCDNLVKCYDVMIDNGWVRPEEVSLVRAWVEDISNL